LAGFSEVNSLLEAGFGMGNFRCWFGDLGLQFHGDGPL
jgi:hypothetical protein